MPTRPNNKPANKLINPLKAELPRTAETITSARIMRLKYSAGPNVRATSTTRGAKNVKAIVPMVPAIKLPIAAVQPMRDQRALFWPFVVPLEM